jgi:parvulin-like peptidyl-prolyl isomerase
MKNILFILFISANLATCLLAQQKDKVIATIGKDNITFEEFKLRFQFMPQVSKGGQQGDEIARRDFLYSLIAEKLWSQEAEKLGLDTSEIMMTTFAGIEKMFIRDALYKKEILSKVKISETEIIKAVQKAKTELSTLFLFSSDSLEILSLYNELKKGVLFDSILIYRHEYQFQEEPLKIEFGKLDEKLETEVFTLEKGKYSKPYKDLEGWFIYIIKDKQPKTFTPNESQKITGNVKTILENRRKEEIFQRFYKKFFGGLKVETNGDLFWSLAEKITRILSETKLNTIHDKNGGVKLESSDLNLLEKEFGKDSLDLPFMLLDNKPLLFKEFLGYFFLDGFQTDTVSIGIISRMLNYRVRNMIELELLAREGYRQGLQHDPLVKKDISMWRESFLSLSLKKSYSDSIIVNEDEIYNYFLKVQKDSLGQTEINIIEILTDSLEVVEKALNSSQTDEEFRMLASMHTKRLWAKEKQGEFGYLPVSSLGEIGRVAMQMQVGNVYGPLKIPEGYSVFKLIGKKEQKLFTKNFEDSKNSITKELSTQKYKELIINRTIELANKNGVSINEDILFNNEIKNLKMYVIRYMGFGGKLTAVPLTAPFTEWVEQWKNSKNKLP